MTTTRSKTTRSKGNSKRKGSSFQTKPLDLKVGDVVNISLEHIKGDKYKVADIKRIVNPEHEIHPAGDFDAVITFVENPKESKTREGMYFSTVRFETEHGRVYGTFYGTLQTVMFLFRNQDLFLHQYQKIRVKHTIHNDRKYCSVDFKF